MIDFTACSAQDLDIYFEIYYPILQQYAELTARPAEKGSEKHTSDTYKFGFIKQEMKRLTDEIKKRETGPSEFSIEELYKSGGQYDHFLIFTFYKTSEAYKKYGDYACGTIQYRKGEREELDLRICVENFEKTNGTVCLEGRCDKGSNLQLRTEGFILSEAFKIEQTARATYVRKYKTQGQKKIPNQITINVDSRKLDPIALRQYVLEHYARDGYALKDHDTLALACYKYVFQYEHLDDQDRPLLLDANGDLNDAAKYLVLDIKVSKKIATKDEVSEFKNVIFKRLNSRLDFVAQHYGIGKNGLDKVRSTHFRRYLALVSEAHWFEDETLAVLSKQISVYWNWERYIHIYSRHYPDLNIPNSTKGSGTPFQYKLKDIRQMVKIILDDLRDEIIAGLSHGNDYEKKAYYYNGNHYSIQIAPDGRLMAFHPRD